MASLVTTAATVEVRGLTKDFAGRRVLGGVDLTLQPGEFVALLGRSGSGKSTLLRVLAGLDRDVDGEHVVRGAVSMAFQQPRLLPWRRVWRNVVLGLPTANPRETADRALAEVGLAERAIAWPGTLSGGEAQRVSLARALVREPDLLLLDEPFAALDALTRLAMHRLVGDLWARHRPAVLLVTHDVDEALALADRVLVLGDPSESDDTNESGGINEIDGTSELSDTNELGARIVAEHVPPAHRPRAAVDLVDLRVRVLSDLGVTGGEADHAFT